MKSSNTVIGLEALGRPTTLCRLKSTTALLPGEYLKDSQQEASEDSPSFEQLLTGSHGGSRRTIGIRSQEQWCCLGIPRVVDTGNAATFTQHQLKIILLLEVVRSHHAWCSRATKPFRSLMAKERVPPKLQMATNCALTFGRLKGSDRQADPNQGPGDWRLRQMSASSRSTSPVNTWPPTLRISYSHAGRGTKMTFERPANFCWISTGGSGLANS
ncbi:hypothetical protein ABIA24_002076 [Sinorhizobium fredii]